MLKNPMNPYFEPLRSIGFDGYDPTKVSKLKYRYGVALSMTTSMVQLVALPT
jgi:hypothetical protein